MNNRFFSVFGPFIVCIVLAVFCWMGYAHGHSAGYRDGQIDAINGKLSYQLTQQDNEELTWEFIRGN